MLVSNREFPFWGLHNGLHIFMFVLHYQSIVPVSSKWNLQITHVERKMIFQTSMIMFHVNLQGRTHYYNIPCEMIRDILCIHSIWICIYLNERAKCCHPWVYSFQLKLMQPTCFLSLPALLTWTCAFKAAPLWKKTNHAWCFCVPGGYVAEPCHRDTMESSVDMGWQQTLTPSKGVIISNRKGKRKSPARDLFLWGQNMHSHRSSDPFNSSTEGNLQPQKINMSPAEGSCLKEHCFSTSIFQGIGQFWCTWHGSKLGWF